MDRLVRSTDARDVLAAASEMFSPAPGSGAAEYARLTRDLGKRFSQILAEQREREAQKEAS